MIHTEWSSWINYDWCHLSYNSQAVTFSFHAWLYTKFCIWIENKHLALLCQIYTTWKITQVNLTEMKYNLKFCEPHVTEHIIEIMRHDCMSMTIYHKKDTTRVVRYETEGERNEKSRTIDWKRWVIECLFEKLHPNWKVAGMKIHAWIGRSNFYFKFLFSMHTTVLETDQCIWTNSSKLTTHQWIIV